MKKALLILAVPFLVGATYTKNPDGSVTESVDVDIIAIRKKLIQQIQSRQGQIDYNLGEIARMQQENKDLANANAQDQAEIDKLDEVSK